jgi:membrane protein required for colicin V production
MNIPIQPYDLLMLVVLLGTLVFGVWKGMAWQLAALGAVILSAVAAMYGSAGLAQHISAQEPWNRFLAMLIVYVVVAGVIWLAFRLVARVIDRLKLHEFDRQLGAVFGLAKGVLYCVIITFFAVTLSETSREMVLQSRSGDLIARGIRDANPVLPDDVRKWLGKYIDELDAKLHEPPHPGTSDPLAAGVRSFADGAFSASTTTAPAAPAPVASSPIAGTSTGVSGEKPAAKKLRDYLPKLK